MNQIKNFYKKNYQVLSSDSIFRATVIKMCSPFIYKQSSETAEIFYRIFSHYLEEAELTLSLLNDLAPAKIMKLLEVGSGLGLVYGYLKKNGYDIYGLEPSAGGGHSEYFQTAQRLMQLLDVDSSHMYPLASDDLRELQQSFDIIFSNNVIEHVSDIKKFIQDLSHVLKPNGLMVHNAPNYLVPFEPHFGIPLVPWRPHLTRFFLPKIKKTSLWKSINFITVSQLQKICRSLDLLITFKAGVMIGAFSRLEQESEFANKHKNLKVLHGILKKTGLLIFLNKLPPCLTTPIIFTIRKKPQRS